MIPSYIQYKYDVPEPKNAFEMMNENLLSILKKYDYVPNRKKRKQYFSQAGRKIIEYDTEGKAIVYNHTGEKVCHAFVDNKGIREGWAILYNEGIPQYKGEWKDYEKHGEGIEYLNDYGDHQYISQKGIWNKGSLQDGVINDVLVHSDGTLIEDLIIQINKQFYYNEHNFIQDFTTYAVANLIVKNGLHVIDTDLQLREVKATYEVKYGEVQWLENYSYEEINLPDINVLINDTKELKLAFNPATEIERLPFPSEIAKSEVYSYLGGYVTEEEIEAYNRELETYTYAQIFGLELNLFVINEGNLKANDIHIELEFPEEIVILEGSKESIKKPKEPILPRSPLDKALSKTMGNGALQLATEIFGNAGVRALPDFYKKDSILDNFTINSNSSFSVDLDENIMIVHCAELLHTRQREFEPQYLLVPKKLGAFDINVSIICEEYLEEKEFTIKLIVEKE